MDSNYDALFDACCYLGRGSIPHFTALHKQAIGEGDPSSETLRNLHSLGHIELLRDEEDGPEVWRVAPPSIILAGRARAFLQGFRSDKFMGQIKELADSKGGKATKTAQENGPSVVTLEGVSPEAVTEIKDEVDPPGGRSVAIYTAPHLSSDLSLITRGELISQLPTAAMPNKAELFDPKSGKYQEIINPNVDGLYRIEGAFRQYRLRHDEAWLSCPYTLGKHAAAADEGLCLMKYDKDSLALCCALGAPLPSPYNSVATKCTGFLPKTYRRFQKEEPRHEYSGVPPGVAAKIMRALYE